VAETLAGGSGELSIFAELPCVLCTIEPVYGRLSAVYNMVTSLCVATAPGPRLPLAIS